MKKYKLTKSQVKEIKKFVDKIEGHKTTLRTLGPIIRSAEIQFWDKIRDFVPAKKGKFVEYKHDTNEVMFE